MPAGGDGAATLPPFARWLLAYSLRGPTVAGKAFSRPGLLQRDTVHDAQRDGEPIAQHKHVLVAQRECAVSQCASVLVCLLQRCGERDIEPGAQRDSVRVASCDGEPASRCQSTSCADHTMLAALFDSEPTPHHVNVPASPRGSVHAALRDNEPTAQCDSVLAV